MKRLSPIDRRLAASWHQRHIEIVAKADAIAAAVGKRIDAAGRKIIGYATTGEANAATYHAIRREWARVIPELLLYLDPVMRSMIRYSDRDAKDRLAVLVPRGWWRMLFPTMREGLLEHLPGEHDQKTHGRFKGGPREKQTDSEAFKKWFGKSKVVDEHGNPLVVYHGTRGVFASFKQKASGGPIFFSSSPGTASAYSLRYGSSSLDDEFDALRAKLKGQGVGWDKLQNHPDWLALQDRARIADANVKPVYLSIQKPLVLSGENESERVNALKDSVDEIAKLKADGYDGIIIRNALDRPNVSYTKDDAALAASRADLFVVFSPNQIKSATGNRGTFDPNSDDITEAGPARGDAFDRLFGPGAFVAGAEPALRGQGTLSDEEYQKLVRQTILPPLMESDVEAIVKSPNPHTGDSWQKRLTDLSNKVKSPDALAGEIVTGMANGENVQQIRDRVDQQVGKLNGSSQRIARTEARRVAEMANRKSWEQLGELLDGAQIIAVLDERTRPKHAARNGTIYRIGGVPRFEDLPILPDEPNCRCTAAPVLKTPSEVANDPKVAAAFSNEKGQHIPDPAAYDQWFKQADEPRRRQAVGSGRYDVVKRRTATTGDKPEWKDFIKPDGSLVPVQTLKRETAAVASERKIEVAVMLAQRENLFRQIAMRPFTIGPTSAEMLTTGIIKRQALSAGAKIAAINPKAAEALIDLAKAEAAAIAAQFPNVDKEELLADVFLAYTIAKNQRSALTQ